VVCEAVKTISHPAALRDWAMDPMREVRAEVSLQLLPPVEISVAIGARIEGFGLGDWILDWILGQDARD